MLFRILQQQDVLTELPVHKMRLLQLLGRIVADPIAGHDVYIPADGAFIDVLIHLFSPLQAEHVVVVPLCAHAQLLRINIRHHTVFADDAAFHHG